MMPTTTTVRVLMKNKSQTRHKKSSLIPARTELGFQKQVFASNIPAVTPDMNIKSIIIIDRHIFHSNFRYVSSSQQSPSLITTMIATSHHQWSHHISSSQWSLCLIINDNQIRSLQSSDQPTYLHSPRSPTVEETSTPSLLSSMITLGGWSMIRSAFFCGPKTVTFAKSAHLPDGPSL